MKKVLPIVLIIIIVAIAGVAVWLFASGRLVWADAASPATHNVAIEKVVCGDEQVNAYNSAMYFKVRAEGQEPSIDEQGLKDLASSIRAANGYKEDPTCQNILFSIAVYQKDRTAGQEALDALNALHDRRLYADSNLSSAQPLYTYKLQLDSATTTTTGPPSGN